MAYFITERQHILHADTGGTYNPYADVALGCIRAQDFIANMVNVRAPQPL